MIRIGDYVEICSNEDGFLGSYYEAIVIGKVGKDRFKVEYTTLLDDKDENKMLREVVEGYKVRPVPPEIRVAEFNVLDKVDAYDNDGWWVGRVSGREGYKYYVYFDSSGDEFLYPVSCLRVHQEFDFQTCQWIPSRYDFGFWD